MSCVLGLARSTAGSGATPGGAAAAEIARRLLEMQDVSARLSARVADAGRTDAGAAELLSAVEQALGDLERRVRLPASFVVPGETRLSAEIHHSRSVCRRAERSCVSAGRLYPEAGSAALVPVLNRLSDYLFVLAVFAAGGSGSTVSV